MRYVALEDIVGALVNSGELRPEEVVDFMEKFTTLDLPWLDQDEDQDDDWDY